MIHYHGTPISGSRQDTARFLLGRHALVSFYHPQDLYIVMECCQSFCLDNGAFSHWKAGKGDINFDDYFNWVQDIATHPGLDWALIPDKIDGAERDNKELIKRWEQGRSKVEGVPVYHLHESLKWLDYLVSNFRTVAIGSSGRWPTPNAKVWWIRMKEVLQVACDEYGRPRCRLHGLRMLNPAVFTRIPLASADSTNAGMNAGSKQRFGTYMPVTAAQRAAVIADRIEANNSPAFWEGCKKFEESILEL